jgi:hypothetical protein
MVYTNEVKVEFCRDVEEVILKVLNVEASVSIRGEELRLVTEHKQGNQKLRMIEAIVETQWRDLKKEVPREKRIHSILHLLHNFFEIEKIVVNPWDYTCTISIAHSYKKKTAFHQDPLVLHCIYKHATRLSGRNNYIDYYDYYNKKRYSEYSEKVKLKFSLYTYLNSQGFFGHYPLAGHRQQGPVKFPVYKIDENLFACRGKVQFLNNNCKFTGKWIRVNNGLYEINLISSERVNDILQWKHRGPYTLHLPRELFIKAWTFRRLVHRLKKSTLVQEKLAKWQQELWKPDGAMCKRTWDECEQVMMKSS